MDPKALSAAVERAMASYTMMGLKGDEERRQDLRETVRKHIQDKVEGGERDVERLVVSALKYLVALENERPPPRRRDPA